MEPQFEEYFAPNTLGNTSGNTSGDESDQTFVKRHSVKRKRFATYVGNTPDKINKIIKELTTENLQQIINNKSYDSDVEADKLEQRIHYLKLELASKTLDIEELKKELEDKSKITKSITELQNTLEIMDENTTEYNRILHSIHLMNAFTYKLTPDFLIRADFKNIKSYTFPSVADLPNNIILVFRTEKNHIELQNSIIYKKIIDKKELYSKIHVVNLVILSFIIFLSVLLSLYYINYIISVIL